MVLAVAVAMAQAPEKFTYQAVVRNASNSLVANAPVGVRVSILQGDVNGTLVYMETQTGVTNANGLITLQIGGGNVQQGAFADIDWANGSYFLKTETDPNGGTNYSITSTQQMLSVPYALYSKEAGNGFSGDYNDLVNVPQIPQIPADVSAFNNDAGYLTDYTETDPQYNAWNKDYNDLINKPTIPTVPTYVSAFTNDAGYLTNFTESDPQFNAWDKDYNDLTNKPTIPTIPANVSAFYNDAGYITSASVPAIPTNVSAFTNDAGYITSANIPTVPANLSAFNNDMGYITTAQIPAQVNADWNATSGAAKILNKPNLFSGNYNDLTNKPTLFDGNYNSLSNKPNLSAVALSGSYNDLLNKPSIPTAVGELTNNVGYITLSQVPAQVNADWNATSGAAQILNKPVLFSGNYNDLTNLPQIPQIPADVSAFNNDAGYITSYTESQILSISNDTLFLTGGSFVKLPAGFDGDYNSLTNKPELFSGDYNDLDNRPQIPQIPADVSAFNNDAGYITAQDIPAIPTVPTNVSAFSNDAGYLTSFTEQQVLSISNDTLFLTGGSFVKLPAGFDGDYNSLTNKPELFSGDYNDLTNLPQIPQIPTDVSAYNNDAGYITSYTESQILSISNDTLFLTGGSFVKLPAGFDGDYNSLTNKPNLFSGNYNDLTNRPQIPQIPADVSAFNNDAGYITAQDIPAIPTVPTNVSAFSNDAGYLTSFTEQQVLSISNDTLFLTGGSFVKLPAGFDGDYNSLTNKPELFSGNYNDLTNRPQIPQIPADVSAFNNDAGYITAVDVQQAANIPTNLSAFENDANYITVADIPAQVNADWNATSGAAQIFNKPTLFSGNYNDLTNKPTLFDGNYNSLSNRPNLATVATTGNYNDLTNLPQIPQIPADVSAFNNDAGYLTDYTETDPQFSAWDKDYNDLTNKPVIPAAANNATLTIQRNGSSVGTFTADASSNKTINIAVPTSTSELTNNSGFITAGDLPAVPENVSAFTNDAGYITNSGSNCDNTVNLCELLDRLAQLENMLNVLTIRTAGVTAVTENTFTVEGEVVNDGGATVMQRGFVYATTHNPTISNNRRNVGSGTGTFSTTITSLTAGTTYYVRAFATNVNGIVYGSEVAVTTTATSPSAVPSVTTVAVIDVTKTQATVRGNVTSDGGETVTVRGFVYDTLANPTTSSKKATNGGGTGSYTNLLSELLPGKTYHIRAYATNSVGTGYGNELMFTTVAQAQPTPVGNDGQPCPATPTVTDHEGNVYNTVQIGTQCWTKENMRATTSPSTGTYLIPPVGTNYTLSGKQACWPNYDSATYAPQNYGLLYNWNAAVDTFNTAYGETSVIPFETNNGEYYAVNVIFSEHRRGICPLGWHVPSDAEWTALTDYVGSQDNYIYIDDTYGVEFRNNSYIAKALASTKGWSSSTRIFAVGNMPGNNNATGFSALPLGTTYFWSSTKRSYGDFTAWTRFIHYNYATVGSEGSGMEYNHSVRCLRDSAVTDGETPVQPDTTSNPTTDTPVDAQPCPGAPTVTDYDGNVYNTVQIGEQCWMAENLRTTHYADGASIPVGGNNSSETLPYYYDHTFSSFSLGQRGYLYNWPAVIHGASSNGANSSGVQGICPSGWHVPSDAEWTQLTQYVGSKSNYLCSNNNSYIAKALASTIGWNSSTNQNQCALGNSPTSNNATGFSAVPVGGHYNNTYYNSGIYANFWSSTEYSGSSAYGRSLIYADADILTVMYNKELGWSVRCLRD